MLNNKTLHQNIRELLTTKPDLREDDMRILANIWNRELQEYIKQKNIPDITVVDMLKMISEKKLSHFEAIRRTRQKLQEEFPELRGPNYGRRKDKKNKMKHALHSYNVQTLIPNADK